MGKDKNLEIKNTNTGFSLMEIMIAVVIIAIFTGFAIARFGDFGVKGNFNKEVSDFIEQVRFAQSYANSRNSGNCAPNDRLSFVSVRRTALDSYELFMTCEYNFLSGGTPTLSPTISMSPRMAKTMTNADFGLPASPPDIDLVTFLPGAITTPGPTIALYRDGECSCIKVSANGIIVKTTKNGCTLVGTVITCNSWEE